MLIHNSGFAKIFVLKTGYDCPTFPNMIDFGCTIVGGTLSAVAAVIHGEQIAINWTGGWHHAQR